MPAPSFEIDDDLSFSENLHKFGDILEGLDASLGPALLKETDSFIKTGAFDRDTVLDALTEALKDAEQ